MKSTEKVAAALDRVEELADDPDSTPDLKMAGAMLCAGRGLIEEKFLPRDPSDLDDLLEMGADWLRGLRSDDD